jgi:hypothetical protein
MTDQEKPGLKPLCDREHGPMETAMLTIDGTDLIPAVRCTFPGCDRVYTPALGYRDLDGRNPGRNKDVTDPRCASHRHHMCVAKEMPDGTLLYVCPQDGCNETATSKAKASGATY